MKLDKPRWFCDFEVVLVEICIIVCRVRKLFRFTWTDSSELGLNLSLLDIFFAYKTIERFDETVAEEITVPGHELRPDDVWGGRNIGVLLTWSTRFKVLEVSS
jgi:hypothetical protein